MQEILPVRAFNITEKKADLAEKGRNNGSCFSLCLGEAQRCSILRRVRYFKAFQ